MTKTWHAFEEPWEEVAHNPWYFSAGKDGFLIGTYNSREEALQVLGA